MGREQGERGAKQGEMKAGARGQEGIRRIEEENHLLGSYFTATLIVSFPTNIWKRFPVFVPSPDAAVAE